MENKAPDYYLPIMPYIIVKDARKFYDFMKEVFPVEEKAIYLRDENSDVIMHGEFTIGKAALMFANSTDEWHECTSGMFLIIDNVDEVYKKAIAAGAESLQEPEDKDYGYSAGFKDPYGNTWWITQG